MPEIGRDHNVFFTIRPLPRQTSKSVLKVIYLGPNYNIMRVRLRFKYFISNLLILTKCFINFYLPFYVIKKFEKISSFVIRIKAITYLSYISTWYLFKLCMYVGKLLFFKFQRFILHI